jgi:hypothetical protein
LLGLALGACGFAPELDGAYRCGPDDACPQGLRCASDGWCRAEGERTEPPSNTVTSAPTDQVSTTGCTPRTCAELECGEALDGCGGVISCGSCTDGKKCGVGGPNRCGIGDCRARNCDVLQAECGLVSDTCSKVIECGHCDDGVFCGATMPNRCG